MRKKILGVLVCTLLIVAGVLPAAGKININNDEAVVSLENNTKKTEINRDWSILATY